MAAIDDFRAGVGEIETLASMADTSDAAEGSDQGQRTNAIRRAAVVLLVSHLESFLKSLAEEYIDAIDSGEVLAKEIPAGLRELHSLPRLQEIVASGDDRHRHVLLGKLGAVTSLWIAEAKVPRGSLSSEKLSRTVTSAMHDKIDELFRLMGSAQGVCDGEVDYIDKNGEEVGLSIRLGLRDVVSLRNDVAHGGSSSRVPTSEDLDRYLGFLTALAGRLDRKCRSLIAMVDAGVARRRAMSSA